MIITEQVKMNISTRNITFYKNKNYDAKKGDTININIKDLIKGSPIKIDVKCDICGDIKNMEYRTYINNTYDDGLYYCNKCKYIKMKKTKKERYGDENYTNSKKYIKTCLDKYGTTHPSKTTKHIEKIKKTKKEKHGDENYNNHKQSLVTKKEKYGDENYNNLEKYRETNLKLYGVDNISKLKSTQEKKTINKKNKLIQKYKNNNIIDIDYEDYTYIYQCNNHISKIPKTIFYNRLETNTTLCTICNPINDPGSDKENKLLDFIKENYNNLIITNDRKILDGKELDIYIPDLKLAFEFNGVYWHNELYRPNNYHLDKTELCDKKNIQLIHIYEDDWVYKQDIVKSMILNKLGRTPNKIYARKTEVKEIIDNKLVRKFLDENHIQGFVGSKIKLGLFYENELISLMTFGKLRKSMNSSSKTEGQYEMLRFCNKLNTNVIGCASKLFKYFIRNYKFDNITTYADRSHSNGKLYEVLGFDFIHKTSPNYYYIIDQIRHHRFNFRKDKLIKEGYDVNKTEHQIMLERKIYRIYNSGNLKYIYNQIL